MLHIVFQTTETSCGNALKGWKKTVRQRELRTCLMRKRGRLKDKIHIDKNNLNGNEVTKFASSLNLMM